MAEIALTHAHQTAIANDPSKDVSATVWNASHTVPQTGTGSNVVSDVSPTVTQPSCDSGLFVTQSGGGNSWYVFVDVDGKLKVESPGAVITQIGPSPRPVLTTNTTVNVPSTFSTLDQALQFAAAIDFGGFQLTIQLAHGTYTPAGNSFNIPATVGQAQVGDLIINGDVSNPDAVVLSAAGSFVGIVEIGPGARCLLQGLQINSSGGGNTHGLHATGGGYCQLQRVDFGGALYFQRFSESSGVIQSLGVMFCSASAQAYMASGAGGFNYEAGTILQLINTPAFATAFAVSSEASYLGFIGTTFTGTGATGARYLAQAGGAINTGGGGINFLPGNAGGTSTTGYYE